MYQYGDRNFPPRNFPSLCSPPVFPPHAKYAVEATRVPNPNASEASYKPEQRRGEVSPQGWKTLGETSGGESP